ncbi:uncharacterized protein EI90DRAFT_3060221 [Cantharellus anzutake]|uniref:uncharacterized protein n=1 Tax=Cantharellus anzutake TaxID=1750568 RepID=UPI0019039A8A|nr:uncharacterized protein EI90DRAFT_3060221 [Cantharellus anzutake]KAF8330312.1 hypothetical protein EI90DRAFT_3060221 [Cantharellus anzutake]
MGMSKFENLYGGFLVGLVLSAIVFGVVTVQAWLYYCTYPKDSPVARSSVGFLWLVQAFQVVTVAYVVYDAGIMKFGYLLEDTKWYHTMYPLVTTISSVTVQFYFIHRLRKLGQSEWVPLLLTIMTLAQLAMGLVICIHMNINHGIYNLIPILKPFLIAWLTIEAGSDVIIAFSMCYFLRKSCTGFRSTDSIIRVLMIYAINTGMLTTVMAMAVMFTYTFYGLHFVNLIFLLPLGGVYTASLLSNLHSRSTLQRRLRTVEEHGTSIHLSRLPPKVRVYFTLD